MSPTPANPAVAVIESKLRGWIGPYDMVAQKVVDALLASDEALRWLGSHVEPEQLGYKAVTLDRSADQIEESVYLAPRRGEEP